MKPAITYCLLAAVALLAVVTVCWRRESRPAPPVSLAPSNSRAQPLALSRPSADLPARRPSRQETWLVGLEGLQGPEAAAWLNAKLNSGQDGLTGEGFVPGVGGGLAQMPTWRVSWLEELGRRDSIAAAAQAEKILANPTTPEEWAVALRWLAQGRPEAGALLEEKTRALLQHEPWQRNPTVAWLEAFDVAVYLGGTSLLPELTELVREPDNRPANHAAFLALDRLVQNDTAQVLAALQEDSDALSGREAMRGNLFARADVSDQAQRRVLEEYLLAPNRTPVELEAFADVFPNANFHLSVNLLTVSDMPNPATRRARDAAALAVVRAWREDVRFAGLAPHLLRIQRRLEGFVAGP